MFFPILCPSLIDVKFREWTSAFIFSHVWCMGCLWFKRSHPFFCILLYFEIQYKIHNCVWFLFSLGKAITINETNHWPVLSFLTQLKLLQPHTTALLHLQKCLCTGQVEPVRRHLGKLVWDWTLEMVMQSLYTRFVLPISNI